VGGDGGEFVEVRIVCREGAVPMWDDQGHYM
jgi:hypothetical protein